MSLSYDPSTAYVVLGLALLACFALHFSPRGSLREAVFATFTLSLTITGIIGAAFGAVTL
ncbi:membrane protein [Mycobacterium phage Telesworld]|nr:membrane protein [Mycobacterium phage Telesworld]